MSFMFRIRLLSTLSAPTWRRSFVARTKGFLKGPTVPLRAQALRPVSPRPSSSSALSPPPSPSPALSRAASPSPALSRAASFSPKPSSAQSVTTPHIVFQKEHNTVTEQVCALNELALFVNQTGRSPGSVTSSENFRKLMCQLVASVPKLSAEQAAQCLWSLSHLGVEKHEFTSLVFAQIIQEPYRFAVRLEAVAVAAVNVQAPPQLWDALRSTILRLDRLPRPSISSILLSFTQAGTHDRALFEHLCRLALQSTATATISDLSSFVFALGKTGYGDSALLQRAAMQLVQRMNEVSPSYLSNMVVGITSYVREHNPQAVSIYAPVIDAAAGRIESLPLMEIKHIYAIVKHGDIKRVPITEKLWVALTNQLARTELTIHNLYFYCRSMKLLYVDNGEPPSAQQLERIDSFLASRSGTSVDDLRVLLKTIAQVHELRCNQADSESVEPSPHLIDFLDANMFSRTSQIWPDKLLLFTERLYKMYSSESPTWKPLQYRFSQMLPSLLISFKKRKRPSDYFRSLDMSNCLMQQCVWNVYDPQLIQFCLKELESITELEHLGDTCAELFLLQTSLNQLPSVHVTYPSALDLPGKVAFKTMESSLKPLPAVIAKVVQSLPAGVTPLPSSSTLNRLPYEPHLLVQYDGKEVAVEIVNSKFFWFFTVRRSQLERAGYLYVQLADADLHFSQDELQQILRTRLQQAVTSKMLCIFGG